MALSQHLALSGPAPVYADPGPGATVVSAKPVPLPASTARGTDLLVRVSAPATGERLPVVVFNHGYGSSLDGYGPLTDYWAAHGYVVLQPTFLDSRTVGVPNGDPRVPQFWRFRAADATRILDELDTLLGAVPGLSARVDRAAIAVAGHSFGGQTAGLLLGLRADHPPGPGRTCPTPVSGPACSWPPPVPAATTSPTSPGRTCPTSNPTSATCPGPSWSWPATPTTRR